MSLTYPNESPEYRLARAALLEREIEQRRLNTEIADLRSHLPAGGEVPEDYVFERLGTDGEIEQVRMSELFEPGKDSLIVYSFMFGPDRSEACGGCTYLLDSLDDVSAYINQKAAFVVVAGSPIQRIHGYAQDRGWMHHKLLSAVGNCYNRDYFGLVPNSEHEIPMLNVFHREGEVIRHFWGSELIMEPSLPGQDSRHNEAIDAGWGMLDFVPEGRGSEWFTTTPGARVLR